MPYYLTVVVDPGWMPVPSKAIVRLHSSTGEGENIEHKEDGNGNCSQLSLISSSGEVLLLSPLAAAVNVWAFFSLIKYVIPEVLPPLLMGLALFSVRSILKLAGIDSLTQRKLVTKDTSVVSVPPQPL